MDICVAFLYLAQLVTNNCCPFYFKFIKIINVLDNITLLKYINLKWFLLVISTHKLLLLHYKSIQQMGTVYLIKYLAELSRNYLEY